MTTYDTATYVGSTIQGSSAVKEAGCICMCSARMSVFETRRADKATRGVGDMFPTSTVCDLYFKPCKERSIWRKILISQTDLVAARVVFLKAVNEIKSKPLTFCEL